LARSQELEIHLIDRCDVFGAAELQIVADGYTVRATKMNQYCQTGLRYQ
jgi:hypothetical protein